MSGMTEWRTTTIAAVLFWLAGTSLVLAQDEPPATVATGDDAPVADDVQTLQVTDEVRALVAPVALYPDPLLAVILQASLFPLDIIQADRFIDDYQADQTLEPQEDWDTSIYALLNYPKVLDEMSEHLDWTEAMGNAVYDELENVQASIQDLRVAAYSMGILESNEVQRIIIEDRIVQIQPISEDRIAIPEYDGFELIGALETVDDGGSLALPEGISPVSGSDELEQPTEQSQTAEVPTTEETELTGNMEGMETPLTEEANADTAAGYAEPAAPSYVQPPTYAAPPPTVTYSEPSSSFWGPATTFLGGAAVGGLLGYAIFDDDDDDNGGGRRTSVNVEDSTIIVGDRSRDRNGVKAELRERRDRGARAERRERERKTAALPGQGIKAKRDKERRDISLPQRDRKQRAKVNRPQQRQTPAIKQPKSKRGAVADLKRPAQTNKEAQRGKSSRQKAANAKAIKGKQQPKQLAAKSGGGKLKALTPKGGKKQAKAKSNRGKKSRGKKPKG
jgi:hypothetical protein